MVTITCIGPLGADGEVAQVVDGAIVFDAVPAPSTLDGGTSESSE